MQQTLSVIGQYGGVRANQLWALLCDTGPFAMVDQGIYGTFLRALAQHELITQTHDGQLILGHKGERFVEHYSFYTAFHTPEEYRLESGGRLLGTMPINKPLLIGELVVFAGKRWEILHVNAEQKVVTLKRATGGRPPQFGGGGQMVHTIVRQEMRRVYLESSLPIYLDNTAKSFFAEGIKCFHDLQLDRTAFVELGNTVHVLPWLGDRITNTIIALFRAEKLAAHSFSGIIDISNGSIDQVGWRLLTLKQGKARDGTHEFLRISSPLSCSSITATICDER